MRVCTNERENCDGCDRPVCRRCGRCFHEVPRNQVAGMKQECPSLLCRIAKRLRRRPLFREDVPG